MGTYGVSSHLYLPFHQPPKMVVKRRSRALFRQMFMVHKFNQVKQLKSSTPRLFSMRLRLVIVSPSTFFGYLRASLN